MSIYLQEAKECRVQWGMGVVSVLLRHRQILETPPDPDWCLPSANLALPAPILSRWSLSCLPSTSSKETKGRRAGGQVGMTPSTPAPSPAWPSGMERGDCGHPWEEELPLPPQLPSWATCLSLCQHSVQDANGCLYGTAVSPPQGASQNSPAARQSGEGRGTLA